MNIEEYIESGILELYLADVLSAEERSDVERMMKQHAEIRDEVSFLREALERAASAPAPPNHIRANLERAIKSDIPHATETSSVPRTASKKAPGMVLPVLLLAALSGMTYLWLTNRSSEERILQLEVTETRLTETNDSLTQALQDCSKKLLSLSSGDIVPVYLASTTGAPEMKVRVFHDTQGTQCYLDETTVPAPPNGKQYQLWALVGDQPTDLGVIDFGSDADLFSALNCVVGATAYAITLEPVGGSATPTLSALSAIGAI